MYAGWREGIPKNANNLSKVPFTSFFSTNQLSSAFKAYRQYFIFTKAATVTVVRLTLYKSMVPESMTLLETEREVFKHIRRVPLVFITFGFVLLKQFSLQQLTDIGMR